MATKSGSRWSARWWGALAAIVTVSAVAWWIAYRTLGPEQNPPSEASERITVEVTQGSVGRDIPITATVTQPFVQIATNAMGGVVTAVSDDVVDVGDTLYEVSGIAVKAFPGEVPFYRDLLVGLSGPDVAQLQNGLDSLGYYNGEIDGDFGPLTAAAVRAWQEDSGLEPTGNVEWSTIVAVPSLPQSVQISENIALGAIVNGGEVSVHAQDGNRVFTLEVSERMASQIPAEAEVVLSFEGHDWPAVISYTTVGENQQSVVVLEGGNGTDPCGSECGVLPTEESLSLSATVTLVPETAGPAVPVAAVTTDVDGSTHVTTEDGRNVAVTILATQDGIVIVDGLEIGDRVLMAESS